MTNPGEVPLIPEAVAHEDHEQIVAVLSPFSLSLNIEHSDVNEWESSYAYTAHYVRKDGMHLLIKKYEHVEGHGAPITTHDYMIRVVSPVQRGVDHRNREDFRVIFDEFTSPENIGDGISTSFTNADGEAVSVGFTFGTELMGPRYEYSNTIGPMGEDGELIPTNEISELREQLKTAEAVGGVALHNEIYMKLHELENDVWKDLVRTNGTLTHALARQLVLTLTSFTSATEQPYPNPPL
jgi:hypothetical protein